MISQSSVDKSLNKELLQSSKSMNRTVGTLNPPCIVCKKIHDIMYPRAVHWNGKWHSYVTGGEVAEKLGVSEAAFTQLRKKGGRGGLGRILADLQLLTDGWITADDVMMSLKLQMFLDKKLELLDEDKNEMAVAYRFHGMIIDELLWPRTGKKAVVRQYKKN